VSHPKVVADTVHYGGVLYLLDLFCSATAPAVRETAAALFAKLLADKLRGPKVRILLCKFLPAIFTDAMRDNAEAAVAMFESKHENPELIWSDEGRAKVQETVARMKNDLYAAQRARPDTPFTLSPEFEVVYENLVGEVVVGGVFLRLLVKQPNWVFRKPKDFVVALTEKLIHLCAKTTLDHDAVANLAQVAEAAAVLFRAQAELAAHIPQLGLVPRLLELMRRPHADVAAALLVVANELCNNAACVRAFAAENCILSIMTAMKGATKVRLSVLCVAVCLLLFLLLLLVLLIVCCRVPQLSLAGACEFLKKLCDAGGSSLAVQALGCDFVQYCLDILANDLNTIECGCFG
jgi:DnaJ family protein C protein 13